MLAYYVDSSCVWHAAREAVLLGNLLLARPDLLSAARVGEGIGVPKIELAQVVARGQPVVVGGKAHEEET